MNTNDKLRLAKCSQTALTYLNNVMDEVAALPFASSEKNTLWETAKTLRSRVVMGGLPDPWPVPLSTWCLRPTVKGQRCISPRQEGKVGCHNHRQSNDAFFHDAWAEAVHYPIGRESIGSRNKETLQKALSAYWFWTPLPNWKPAGLEFDLDQLLADLAAMGQELSA